MVPTVDPNYKPRRINKAIELWEDNQIVSYAEFGASGAPDTYEEGKRMSQTYYDAINYEMENDSFSIDGLRNFMQGLVDGGPTPSGHRTPMVFVPFRPGALTVPRCAPICGRSPSALAAGAHGVLICEMELPEAAQVAIAGARYKWTWPGVEQLPLEGCRGAGSQAFAAHIWGISTAEYSRVADVWPHNPKGEITMGFKLENRRSVESCEEILSVPRAWPLPNPVPATMACRIWAGTRCGRYHAGTARRPAGLQALGGDLERIRLAARRTR